MSKIKIFNDPIYGLVSFPFEIIYELIDHKYVQRLRRISQLGMSNYVYPGACHSRFHHALGTAHLCTELITTLRSKGVQISDDEYEALCIAALLHDLGHGPFSHALEYEIIPFHHEDITIRLLNLLNEEFDGRLSLAIDLYEKKYRRPFLFQALSSQLDIDRMDYLNRDSFYTGVAEGIIGYQRILKMMNVVEDQLVIEEKGIYSVEKFIVSRHMMYHQVYLHKTAISTEQMLVGFFRRYKELHLRLECDVSHPPLDEVIVMKYDSVKDIPSEKYVTLDDYDLMSILKKSCSSSDFTLNYLANGIVNRNLFRTLKFNTPITEKGRHEVRKKVMSFFGIRAEIADNIVFSGKEVVSYYSKDSEILIESKAHPSPIKYSDFLTSCNEKDDEKIYFLSYPKEVSGIPAVIDR